MPSFKVIRASAGSGKTFNLTREYLRLLFTEQDKFMHILAVTFTNKATEEMKSRIIKELFALSVDQPSKQLVSLMESTGMTEKQLRNRAGNILKRLLHRYSAFSVNTIDAFFQRIIRSFTRELGIQEGYAIELDTELLLTEIIDQLMEKAGNDKALLEWLTRFAESLIEKGENWNFRKGMRSLGKEIFKESFKLLDETAISRFSDRSFLKQYQGELNAIVQQIDDSFRQFGRKAMACMASRGLEVDDFSRKGSGPAGFLTKLASGGLLELNATAIAASTEIEKWHTAASLRKAEIRDAALQELMPLMQQVVDYYSDNYRKYHTSAVILKNLYTLGILADLSALANAWCAENNVFLLAEAPGFLNKIIAGNDTPFIYEKTGCWYDHYMIDEFQDTSLLQWSNFKPLISNSLSQDHSNLAVGDAKQSIYRWRNSNWEIIENHISNEFLPAVLDQVTLRENWRSGAEIIRFNNRFFSSASSILQDEYNRILSEQGISANDESHQALNRLYSNMEQVPGSYSQSGGYVEVNYVAGEEDSGFTEQVNQRMVNLICELQDRGYPLRDIAVLTRKNSEARQLADYLLAYADTNRNEKYRFDVISEEALRIGNSVLACFIVALLRYLINPKDLTNNYYLFSGFLNYIHPEGSKCWINPKVNGGGPMEDSHTALPAEFENLLSRLEFLSLTEIVEQITTIFKLENFRGELVYLQAFRDMAMDYTMRHSGDITKFITYWDETGKDRSVSAPSGQDALRILTLHKAKGLEFKITIIPYCTWELTNYGNTYLWCKPQGKPYDKLDTIPLSFNLQLAQTIFHQDYFNELYNQFVDNLNLLYVAFTRAQEALYIFCKSRKEEKLKNVSDLSRRVLGNDNCQLGKLPHQVETSDLKNGEAYTSQQSVSPESITQRIRIACQGKMIIDATLNKPLRPINEGRILHEMFNLIRYEKDIPAAVNRLYQQGKITTGEKDKYEQIINLAIRDPQVSDWFTTDWQVLNESEIILPGGFIRRPDRVMMKTCRTVVVDYKFGMAHDSRHEQQVISYAKLLADMGYDKVEAFLWYVRLGRVIAV